MPLALRKIANDFGSDKLIIIVFLGCLPEEAKLGEMPSFTRAALRVRLRADQERGRVRQSGLRGFLY